jgi:hypothetical protein
MVRFSSERFQIWCFLAASRGQVRIDVNNQNSRLEVVSGFKHGLLHVMSIGFYSPKPKLIIWWNLISISCLSVLYSECLFLRTLMEWLIAWLAALPLLGHWSRSSRSCNFWWSFSSFKLSITIVNLAFPIDIFVESGWVIVSKSCRILLPWSKHELRGYNLGDDLSSFESHYQSFRSFDSSKAHDPIILSSFC